MSLNSRKSLDPRFSKQSGSKPAAGFMSATVRVIRKTPGATLTYDQDTRSYSGGYDTIWSGPARISLTTFSSPELAAQDQSFRQTVRMQITDLQTGINVDDSIIIVDAPYAPELYKFRITVKGTMGTSNPWLTDLVCHADLKHA